jgi:hypothetical protein
LGVVYDKTPMTSSEANKTLFFQALESSFRDQSFCKATLSNPSQEQRWKRIVINTFTDSKGNVHVSFEYSDGRQVERKNYSLEQSFSEIASWIPLRMRNAFVKLSHEELTFEATDHGSYRLKRREVSAPASSAHTTHNRQKNYLISTDSPFLIELGIASKAGEVRRDRHDKFRQIQKFAEIILDLVSESTRPNEEFSIVDFGSGKHYLTFALHHLLQDRYKALSVTGVEQRPELVEFGQEVVRTLGLSNLHFTAGSIASHPLESADLVVALHACNTATDDALAKAIRAKARYICVAPCCHAYVRQHCTASDDLKGMLRHGIIAERFAEGLTDSLRVLTLEALGYQTKLFEFISLEHTAKNVMITARYTGQKRSASLEMLHGLQSKFCLSDFYLDRILSDLLPLSAPV